MSTDPGPVERARALIEEVQRYGLRSAVAVVDRYATRVEQALGTNPAGPPGEDPDRLLRSVIELADAAAQLLGSPTTGAEHLVFPPAAAGSVSRRGIWVHNPGTGPVSVTVRVTDLACAGPHGVIRAPAPYEVGVPAQSSAEVPLEFAVPTDTPPGDYHGLALLPGAADPVILSLRVRGTP